ncbi:MAG TPA: glycosyltransferase family 8 protein [Bacilli bacterium]|nr:glycosyltransferase family 8 protein [Bacilli bacterium]
MLNVLYTVDNNYAMYMIVSIYSLLKNNQDLNINVYIISDNLSKETINELLKIFMIFPQNNLIINDSKKLINKVTELNIPKWRQTSISNTRLFFNDIIDVDKILYLDSDTIIVNSLKNLNNLPDKSVYAVQDLLSPNYYKKMSNDIDTYYNSGVLLLNRNEWENNNCSEKIINTISNNENILKYPDQDILNIALNNDIGKLDIKYNLFSTLKLFSGLDLRIFLNNAKLNNFYNSKDIENAQKNPVILHCVDCFGIRPWNDKLHPYAVDYYRYLKEIFPNVSELDELKLYRKLIFNIINRLKVYTPVEVKDSIKNLIKYKKHTNN